MPEEDTTADTSTATQTTDDTSAKKSSTSAGFVAITSQDDFDEVFDKRWNREQAKLAAKYKDFDSLKEKASQYDALAAASQTDSERAASEASKQARQDVLATATPRLVRAEFKAAAKGVLDAAQLTALLEDLDLSKYANEDGDVDESRIAKKVAALAPPKESERKFPDLGGGQRGGTAKSNNMNDLIRRAAGFSG